MLRNYFVQVILSKILLSLVSFSTLYPMAAKLQELQTKLQALKDQITPLSTSLSTTSEQLLLLRFKLDLLSIQLLLEAKENQCFPPGPDDGKVKCAGSSGKGRRGQFRGKCAGRRGKGHRRQLRGGRNGLWIIKCLQSQQLTVLVALQTEIAALKTLLKTDVPPDELGRVEYCTKLQQLYEVLKTKLAAQETAPRGGKGRGRHTCGTRRRRDGKRHGPCKSK
jgi:hypothetical protein